MESETQSIKLRQSQQSFYKADETDNFEDVEGELSVDDSEEIEVELWVNTDLYSNNLNYIQFILS